MSAMNATSSGGAWGTASMPSRQATWSMSINAGTLYSDISAA